MTSSSLSRKVPKIDIPSLTRLVVEGNTSSKITSLAKSSSRQLSESFFNKSTAVLHKAKGISPLMRSSHTLDPGRGEYISINIPQFLVPNTVQDKSAATINPILWIIQIFKQAEQYLQVSFIMLVFLQKQHASSVSSRKMFNLLENLKYAKKKQNNHKE